MNENLRNFWRDLKTHKDHIFCRNSICALYGESLFVKSYDYLKNVLKPLDENDYRQIEANDYNNKEILEQLSIKAVNLAFDCEEAKINAIITDDVDVNNSTNAREKPEYDTLSKKLKDEINKRIVMNLLIQGASIHSFITLHHIVDRELKELRKDIVDLYDKYSTSSLISYYFNDYDYSAMLEMPGFKEMAVAGSSKVTPQGEVEAKAKIFPVLCQEVAKGVLELLSLHGLSELSEEELEIIYNYADNIEDEPRYIQIGAELWRSVLKFRKYAKVRLPELIMKISLMHFAEIEKFTSLVIEEDYENAEKFIY